MVAYIQDLNFCHVTGNVKMAASLAAILNSLNLHIFLTVSPVFMKFSPNLVHNFKSVYYLVFSINLDLSYKTNFSEVMKSAILEIFTVQKYCFVSLIF